MKTLKKVLAITLALAMVFSFAVTAFASNGGYDITITSESTGHKFVAYQILTGSVTGEKSKSLGDPAYGADVDGSGLAAKLKVADAASLAEYISKCDASALIDFAAVAADYVSGGTTLTESPAGTYKATGLEAGYYLVVDESNLGDKHDANSRYILAVVTNVEVTAKIDYPDVEKDVLDNNDSNSADPTNGWGKSADHDINDLVDFRLTGDIPDTTGYETYYYRFHDTMDTRLALQEGSFKVTVGGVEITTADYKLVTDTKDGCTFEIIIKDLIKVIEKVKDNADPKYDASKGVVVTYQAKLTEDAVIGMPGQENKVKLEFSNNPNWTGDGEPGNPDNPDEPDGPTGETPEKTVVVFTYEADVNKTDEKGEDLSGAKFTLEKFVEDENGTLDEKTGKKGSWVAVKETTATPGSTFEFKGLDDGYYRLTETEAPAGYNKLADPIYFTVSAEHDMSPKSLTVTVDNKDFEVEGGSLSTDVKNNKGVELPETGGIGTTIFYVVGGLIVLAAAVLLITKRRMKDVD